MRVSGTATFICALISASAVGGVADRGAIDHVVSRVTFGPTAADRRHAEEIGIRAYIDEQLDPSSIDDAALDRRLVALSTLRSATPQLIARFNPPTVRTPPDQPFASLCTISDAPTNSVKKSPGPQPVVSELQRAALLRAIYSRRQLYERLVHFWENHFNIY